MYLWWPEVKGQASSLDTPHCVFSYKVSLLNLEFTSSMGYLVSELEDSPVLAPSAPRLQKHVTTLGFLCGCCGSKLRSPSLWSKNFITETTFQAPPSNILERKRVYVWWVGWNAFNIFGCLITWSQLVSIGKVLGGMALVEEVWLWGLVLRFQMLYAISSLFPLFLVWGLRCKFSAVASATCHLCSAIMDLNLLEP